MKVFLSSFKSHTLQQELIESGHGCWCSCGDLAKDVDAIREADAFIVLDDTDTNDAICFGIAHECGIPCLLIGADTSAELAKLPDVYKFDSVVAALFFLEGLAAHG